LFNDADLPVNRGIRTGFAKVSKRLIHPPLQ
jgi:hypothetical protein